MSGSLADLVVNLTMQTAQFHGELHKTSTAMNAQMGQMVGAVGGLQNAIGAIDGKLAAFGTSVGAIFGVVAAGGVMAMMSKTIEAAARMDDLAKVTGITAAQLAAMREAAAKGGVSMEEVANASVRFSKALMTAGEGGDDMHRVLTALGISMEEIKTKSPAEQMHLLAERLNEFGTSAAKTTAASVLFVKGGAQLLPFLEELGQQTLVVDEKFNQFASDADQLGDMLAVMRLRQQEVVESAAKDLLPAMNAILGAFAATNREGREGIGIWSAIGDVLRVVSLGAMAISTALKNIGLDVAAVAATVRTAMTGTSTQIAAIWRARNEDVEANNQALSAFYDKVSEGSALLGTLAGRNQEVAAAHNEAADGAKKQTLSLDGVGKAALKAAEDALKFIERLKEEAATVGLGETAKLRYQAAQKGVAKEAEQYIKRIEQEKAAMELLDRLIKESIEDEKAYAKAKEEVKKLTDATLAQWSQENSKMREEIDNIGKTKGEIERLALAKKLEHDQAMADLIEEGDARKRFLDQLRKEYEDRLTLINNRDIRQAEEDAAQNARRVWEDAAKDIERALEDAIMGGMKSGESLGQALRNSLQAMFRTLVLRPILQPIANGMAGMMQGMMGMLGGSSGPGGPQQGGMGLGDMIGSLFGQSGTGLGDMIGSLFGQSGGGLTGMVGSMMIGSSLETAGTLMTTLGETIGTMIPVIGWVIAIVSILSQMFSSQGGPQSGAWATQSYTNGLVNDDLQANSPSGGGDLHMPVGIMGAIQSGYMRSLGALGGKPMEGYRLSAGYQVDPEGTTPPYAIITINRDDPANNALRYEQQQHLYDSGKFDPENQQAWQLFTAQAVMAAVRASELPDFLQDVFDAAIPERFDTTQIDQLMQFAQAIKAMHDMVGRDLSADVDEAVTASRRTVMESYFAQGEALRELMANFDGSTESAVALAQATQQYYQAQVQLLAQIANMREALTGEFGSWEQMRRGFTYSLLEGPGAQRAFIERDIEALLAQLRTSSDPTNIQNLSGRLQQDLQQLWQFLSTTERQDLTNTTLDQIMELTNARLAEAERRIRDDPNAPQNIMRDAGDIMHDAALAFVDAANRQNAAAYSMATAASRRQEVDVDIRVYDQRLDWEVNAGDGASAD